MEFNTVIQIVLGIIGGGGLTILSQFFIGKKKRLAEANETEVDSSVKINREWERLYKEISEEFHKFKEANDAAMEEMRDRISSLESELIQEKKEVFRLSKLRQNDR